MKKLYWNDTIKVKLTDYGKDIYYHQYDHLIERGIKIERLHAEVDEDGYSKFQLWSFMHLYGEYIGLAMPNVVEDISFYIDDNDLNEVRSKL